MAALFPAHEHANLLIGLDGTDDAAVYELRKDEAIIATVDFFPPIVDDPYDFGSIAAANAMSDVFAMGGEVLLALNLLSMPEELGSAIVQAVLMGGAEKVREAGGVVAGGHSVIDREPKYGMAVLGRVHPERILRVAGARPGDVLVLTKPLGTGLVTTALKAGQVEAEDLAGAVASMKALNDAAGRIAMASGATAATDVTGFGFVGHALEIADRSSVALQIDVAALPLLGNVLAYARKGFVPGGTKRNRAAYEGRVHGREGLDPALGDVLFDPQTSGGLLATLPRSAARECLVALEKAGVGGRAVGTVVTGEGLELRQQARGGVR